jgi:tape measure domain-containing protein
MDTNGLQKGVNGVKSIITGLGITKIIGKAFDVLTNSIDGAISRIDILNNFPKVMSNLGIGAEESKEAIDDLSKRLQGVPTTLDDAALAVQRFTSKNGDVRKSVDIFDAVNNAILAGGASADIQRSALEQLSQAYTKGKPDMMEWRTLQTAMPAQLKQVATAMGMTTESLGENLRNGKISMDDFIAKIVEMNKTGSAEFKSFSEQARNATGGIKTGITNAKTAVVRGVGNIISSINDSLINSGIGSIGDIFTKVGKTAETALKWIGEKVAEYAPIIIRWVRETATKIREWVEKVQLRKAIENLWKVIQVVAKSVLKSIKPIYDFIKDKIIPIISKLIKAFAEKIDTKALENLQKVLDGIMPVIVGVTTAFLTFKTVAVVTSVIDKIRKSFILFGYTLSSLPYIAIIAGIVAALMSLEHNLKEGFEDAERQVHETFGSMGKAFDDYGQKIQNAESMLDSFNTSLFQTDEEQMQIERDLKSIQDDITTITSRAYQERRDLTDEEMKQIDEYLEKLRKLRDKQVELELQVSKAITQQAKTSKETFQGTATEYEDLSAKSVKTAQEQKDKIVKYAEEAATSEIAILNQKYGDRATITNESYKKEYDAINKRKEQVIKSAKEEYTETVGYWQQGLDTELTVKKDQLKKLLEISENRKKLNDELAKNEKTTFEDVALAMTTYGASVFGEHVKHEQLIKDIEKADKQLLAETEATLPQLVGAWAVTLEEISKNGGEVSEENREIGETILKIYDNADEETRKSMQSLVDSIKRTLNTAQPEVKKESESLAENIASGLDGLQSKGEEAGKNFISGIMKSIKNREGDIIQKAEMLGREIVAQFNKGQDAHSPSRKMYKAGINFLAGFTNAIKDNTNKTYAEMEAFGDGLVDRMSNAVNIEADKVTAKALLTGNIDKSVVINANFTGNVEMDNKKVGRILAPDISQALKVGGL